MEWMLFAWLLLLLACTAMVAYGFLAYVGVLPRIFATSPPSQEAFTAVVPIHKQAGLACKRLYESRAELSCGTTCMLRALRREPCSDCKNGATYLQMNDDLKLCAAAAPEGGRKEPSSPEHEIMVHFACRYLSPSHPKKVMLIGGANGFAMQEVLKYDTVERVYVLDPDHAIVAPVCVEKLGSMACSDDERVVLVADVPVLEACKRMTREKKHLQSFDLVVLEDLSGNGETCTDALWTELQALLTMRGVAVHAGEGCKTSAGNHFRNTVVFGYDNDVLDKRTNFVLASDVNLVNRSISISDWNRRNIPVHFYEPSKHFSYIPWLVLQDTHAAHSTFDFRV